MFPAGSSNDRFPLKPAGNRVLKDMFISAMDNWVLQQRGWNKGTRSSLSMLAGEPSAKKGERRALLGDLDDL